MLPREAQSAQSPEGTPFNSPR